MIGCHCEVCRSEDPRNRRNRPSVLVRYEEPSTIADQRTPCTRRLLIDATAELRIAALQYGIDQIDGVLITHAHADHVFGIDDLRRYNAVSGQPMDLFADEHTYKSLQRIFRYIFEPHCNVNQSFVPQLILQSIEPGQPFDLFGATWTPLRLMHGRLPILGFRVDLPGPGGGSLAYCTDVSSIVPDTYPLLEDLDVLVIDALRYRHHPTHFTVDQALAQIDQIQPGRAYLTHIAHDIEHADLQARLPEKVYLSFDGLKVQVARNKPANSTGMAN